MTESARIDQLRRRVARNPASVSFAALAEEYRRAGDYREAIAVCRAGLVRHPAYVSPRVTLAEALLALGEVDQARREFQYVLHLAPDNQIARASLHAIERGPLASGGPAAAVPAAGIERDRRAVPRLERFLAAILRARAADDRRRADAASTR